MSERPARPPIDFKTHDDLWAALNAAEATIKRLEAEKDRLNEESSRNVSYAQFDNHQLREERGRLLETCAVDAGLAAEKEETIRRLQAKVAELEALNSELRSDFLKLKEQNLTHTQKAIIDAALAHTQESAE